MEDTITLPFKALQTLLYGDESLFGLPKRSGKYDNCVIYKCVWELGAYIKEKDPKEDYFHVKLYPSQEKRDKGEVTSHAEIWLGFEWDESIEKRIEFRAKCAAERENYDEDKILLNALVEELQASKIPMEYALEYARIILTRYRKGEDLKPIITMFELEHLLK